MKADLSALQWQKYLHCSFIYTDEIRHNADGFIQFIAQAGNILNILRKISRFICRLLICRIQFCNVITQGNKPVCDICNLLLADFLFRPLTIAKFCNLFASSSAMPRT